MLRTSSQLAILTALFRFSIKLIFAELSIFLRLSHESCPDGASVHLLNDAPSWRSTWARSDVVRQRKVPDWAHVL